LRVPDGESAAWLAERPVAAEEVSIHVGDPAYHAGLGLFETLALREGAILDLERHLERLAAGCATLGLAAPSAALRESILLAAGAQRAPFGWLKIVCTRGGHRAVFTGAMSEQEIGRSVGAVTLPWRRNPRDPLAGIKSLNYAGNVLGLEEARRRGADEGLWLNTRGHLAEGCTSNLFVASGRKLFTARVADGILPGVVRDLVLDAAREQGWTVHEGKLRLPRLRRATEAFLTSSLCGVRPLVRFDGRPVGSGRPGAGTRSIAERVERSRSRTPGSAAPRPSAEQERA